MVILTLNIKDEAVEKVISFLNSLPKGEVQIIKKEKIKDKSINFENLKSKT